MKRIWKPILLFLLILLLTIPASAHPGRTDSNGGHWDRSNGTYHYHTGEYAGRSQTSSSSTAPTNPPVTSPPPTRTTTSSATTPAPKKEPEKEEPIVPIQYCLIAIPIFCIITWIIRARSIDKVKYEEWNKQAKSESSLKKEIAKLKEENASLKKANSSAETKIAATKSTLEKSKSECSNAIADRDSFQNRLLFSSMERDRYRNQAYAADSKRAVAEKELSKLKEDYAAIVENRDYYKKKSELASLCRNSTQKKLEQLQAEYDEIIRKLSNCHQDICRELPQDTYLNSDFLPIKCTKDKPFGFYTVYRNHGSNVYHERYLCNYATDPIHVYRAMETMRPCKICVRNPNLKEIPEWYKNLQKQKASSADPFFLTSQNG